MLHRYNQVMKPIRVSLLCLSALALAAIPSFGMAQNSDSKQEPAKYTGPKKRVAVMPMDVANARESLAVWLRNYSGTMTVEDVGLKLNTMMTTALVESGRFVVLERQDIGDIKNEMSVTEQLGNEQTKVRPGNVLGAQMLVRCAVTEFTSNSKSAGGGVRIGNLSLGGGQKVARLALDVKFFDPSTSEVLYVAKAEGDSKSSSAGVGVTSTHVDAAFGGSSDEPIERATRTAIGKAVQEIISKLEKMPWEGTVAKVGDDGTVVINRGEDDGVHVGDTLTIYQAGETITDPDSGKVIGRDEDKRLGTMKITSVQKRLSRGTVVEGSGFKVKNIVKY